MRGGRHAVIGPHAKLVDDEQLRLQIDPEPALEAVLGRGTPEILESEGARTK